MQLLITISEGFLPQVKIRHHAGDVLTVKVVVRLIDIPHAPGTI